MRGAFDRRQFLGLMAGGAAVRAIAADTNPAPADFTLHIAPVELETAPRPGGILRTGRTPLSISTPTALIPDP